MKFDADAYIKLYPRKEKEVTEKVETMVEGFTPTADEAKNTEVEDGHGTDGELVS